MNGENPFNIQIKAIPMGRDISFVISGGRAHIGAVATAYWLGNDIEVKVIELPKHKEGELAKECAITAAKDLKCTTTVSMGIHIDNATREQIDAIISYVKHAMAEIIKTLR